MIKSELIGVYTLLVAAGPAGCVALGLLTSLLDKRKKDASVHLLTELEVSISIVKLHCVCF